MLTWAAHSGTVGPHSDATSQWLALAVIAFVVSVGAVAVPTLGVAISRAGGRLRWWRGRHKRQDAAAHAEARARAMMSQLCPHGWRAQITLFADADPDDHRPLTPGGGRARVALDWTELRDGRRPAVMRRVWAGSVSAALEAMVADRRTDETLEQIERGAVADGVLWPE